jgi:hypothetical protein
MLPRSVVNRRPGVKAAFTYADVFGILLHLLDVLVVLPPIYETRYRSCVLMSLSHATRHVGTRGGEDAIVVVLVWESARDR